MKRGETRAGILKIGAELICRRGFNATGIDVVLKKAGVPKGSFYHYFPSKDDFGLAIIEQGAAEYREKLEAFLTDSRYTPLQRVRNFLESGIAAQENSKCKRGCLMGNLGQEMASQSEKFRQRIDEVFQTWKAMFAACFAEARKQGELAKTQDPEQLAGFFLTGWEGAILHAKVTGSVRPLREFSAVLFEKVFK